MQPTQPTQPTLLCVASQKGGVGKTTTSISVAHKLALEGHKTLLVDLDSQGHCAISLGMDPKPDLFDFLAGHAWMRNAWHATPRGFKLLPSDSHLRIVESQWSASPIYQIQFQHLADLVGFEYIVFDTAAGGVLQESAMQLAHHLIIPVRLEALGMDGVAATLAAATVLLTRAQVMILPVMFDKRVSEHSYNLSVLKDKYGDCVADPIPARIAVAEAVAYAKTIWEYEASGVYDVRAAYTRLVERILHGSITEVEHDR